VLLDGRSAKSQFKAADRSGARLALVIGEDEARDGTIGLKDLIEGGGQVTVPAGQILDELAGRLG